MDNNLLKQLIAQHRRVVIPDFGAFLKKETPEGEELVFSPFLRKDDGVVTDAIVRGYGVDTEDARAMVAEFVIYLRQSLASSGRYYIEGVGMLAADANGTVTLKAGEAPEPEPVETEAVPEPVRAQPVPSGQPLPGMTARPQSIQVQGQPQAQQAAVPPVQQTPQQLTGQAQQPPVPGYPQRPVMPVQQAFPRTQQIPHPQQQAMRPPVPGQMPGQPMRPPMPAPIPQRQPPIPPSQRQPQPGLGGSGIPPRGPQEMNQSPQQPMRAPMSGPNGGGRGSGMPGGPNGKPGQPGRRPMPPRRRPQKTKTDVWLIVAIVAALVVIAIMIYGFINTGKGDIDMEMLNAAMAPVQDSTAQADPGAWGL